jgi:hypothetical protein
LTLREEHRLRVFENSVLRRIFGLKRDELTGGGEGSIMRTCKIKEAEMGRACSAIGGKERNAYRLLVGMSEGKRPLGRPRYRWFGNIKMRCILILLNRLY